MDTKVDIFRIFRTCYACKRKKRLTLFAASHQKNRKFGRAYICKECDYYKQLQWIEDKDNRKRHNAKYVKYHAMKRLSDPVYLYFKDTKAGAIRRGIHFGIALEDFREWWAKTPGQCHYCEVVYPGLQRVGNREVRRFTIDRKNNDPFIGYTLDNICKSCWVCNRVKCDYFDYNQFREIAAKFIKPKWMAKLAEEASKKFDVI